MRPSLAALSPVAALVMASRPTATPPLSTSLLVPPLAVLAATLLLTRAPLDARRLDAPDRLFADVEAVVAPDGTIRVGGRLRLQAAITVAAAKLLNVA